MNVFNITSAIIILIVAFITLFQGNLLLALFEVGLLCALLLSAILLELWELNNKL